MIGSARAALERCWTGCGHRPDGGRGGRERDNRDAMGFLLEAAVLILFVVVLYMLFGPAALGLPMLVGVLVVAAAWSLVPQLGGGALLLLAAGLVLAFLVIGMAMRLGPTSAEEERGPPPLSTQPVQEPPGEPPAAGPREDAGG